ncbi:translation initiation factor IF-2 subunit beta, partial [Nanoarchaeota archaeon]
RFSMPKFDISYQGRVTILKNFYNVAKYLNRDPKHIIKFLTRELAAPVEEKGNQVRILSKVPRERVQHKLEQYVEEYVLCKECKHADTVLEKEGRITFKRCLACGARTPVVSIK